MLPSLRPREGSFPHGKVVSELALWGSSCVVCRGTIFRHFIGILQIPTTKKRSTTSVCTVLRTQRLKLVKPEINGGVSKHKGYSTLLVDRGEPMQPSVPPSSTIIIHQCARSFWAQQCTHLTALERLEPSSREVGALEPCEQRDVLAPLPSDHHELDHRDVGGPLPWES